MRGGGSHRRATKSRWRMDRKTRTGGGIQIMHAKRRRTHRTEIRVYKMHKSLTHNMSLHSAFLPNITAAAPLSNVLARLPALGLPILLPNPVEGNPAPAPAPTPIPIPTESIDVVLLRCGTVRFGGVARSITDPARDRVWRALSPPGIPSNS